jgi:hypothetical protein
MSFTVQYRSGAIPVGGLYREIVKAVGFRWQDFAVGFCH